jgi:NADH-quinone oxidoreductase subunit G
MSDGDEYLAATAKPARALVSPATASEVGERVTVSTARGAITVPVVVADIPDGVVWLPTNARGCAVRATLGAVAGDIVTIAPGGARS